MFPITIELVVDFCTILRDFLSLIHEYVIIIKINNKASPFVLNFIFFSLPFFMKGVKNLSQGWNKIRRG